MEPCPCGSSQTYSDCCEPLIQGREPAKTAEALMRSRYTAFVKTEVDYIHNTIDPERYERYRLVGPSYHIEFY